MSGRPLSGRRRLAIVAVAALLLAAIPFAFRFDRKGTAAGAGPAVPASAEVVRTTLVDQEEVEGRLGFEGGVSVVGQSPGTLTRLAGKGQVVERGQVLYEVDGRPVRLLYGERPAWRPLGEGVTDGPDVRQLEENLVALGHATRRNLTVDERWSTATTEAVRRWQEATGRDQTGVVGLGDAVFAPGALRVSDHPLPLGSVVQPGTEVLKATLARRVVTVDLDARRQALARVGEAVEVVLPDGRRVNGRIADVAKVAENPSDDQAGGGGGPGGGDDEDPTVNVTVALQDPAATGDLDQAPVRVRLTNQRAENVLAVPVNALLALAEGGNAVEVVDGARRRLVPVETGLFAGGRVQVTGEGLAEGMRVVVPS
jgi:hypothetical protein